MTFARLIPNFAAQTFVASAQDCAGRNDVARQTVADPASQYLGEF
jgi:hypothetical protein